MILLWLGVVLVSGSKWYSRITAWMDFAAIWIKQTEMYGQVSLKLNIIYINVIYLVPKFNVL